jgi:cyclase
MHSTLIVARMQPEAKEPIAQLFGAFDQSEMPERMGTRRRQLFFYNGLYFHLQDFEQDTGGAAIDAARSHPLFIDISKNMQEHVTAYDPRTWRSPADAMASSFYHWERS